jgi:hypothetical protein
MLVASPRNHRYLQFEVTGFRGPRCVLGRTQHRGQRFPFSSIRRPLS